MDPRSPSFITVFSSQFCREDWASGSVLGVLLTYAAGKEKDGAELAAVMKPLGFRQPTNNSGNFEAVGDTKLQICISSRSPSIKIFLRLRNRKHQNGWAIGLYPDGAEHNNLVFGLARQEGVRKQISEALLRLVTAATNVDSRQIKKGRSLATDRRPYVSGDLDFGLRTELCSGSKAKIVLEHSSRRSELIHSHAGPVDFLEYRRNELIHSHAGPVDFLEYRRNSLEDPAPLFASVIHTAIASGGKSSKPALKDPEQDRMQIFIRTLSGKTICKQIWTGLLIKNLKDEIQADMGIPSNMQSLIHEGKILQDNFSVQHYGIGRDSTIIISTRLRGGSSGSGPKGSGSFKDAVKGKGEVKNKPSPSPDLPGPYIVEQRTQTPALQIDLPEVKNFHSDLASLAVICKFNGFWPKTDALRQWIFSTWTTNCDIHLCSKGFFIVKFDTAKEKDYALHEGPWFWGNAGLFMNPWFPGFDPSTMVVSKMPVWVRLHNLPLHFWFPKVFAAVGNAIGSFIKQDVERIDRCIHTFARICVEVDLSEGLPDNIILIHNNSQWKQPLDYENTAFRCRGCQQTGHLQNNCPQNKRETKRNKKQVHKPRGWQCTVNPEEEIEEEGELNAPPEQHDDPIGENIAAATQTANNQEHMTSDSREITTSTYKSTKIHQNHAEMTTMDTSVGGIKRHHHSENSDSDKETGLQNAETQLVIASIEPTQGEWRKVEKKKGRKA